MPEVRGQVARFYGQVYLTLRVPDQIRLARFAYLTIDGTPPADGVRAGGTTSGVVFIAVNKQRVKDVLYPALKKMGYKYSVSKQDGLRIYDEQLYSYMKPLSVGNYHKKLPDWIWELSQSQCRILLENMLLGDGSWNENSNSASYWTSSKNLADDMMRLCLHCGYSGYLWSGYP